ncbi:MAG: DUF3800 domain-containing protein [Verrucomicrobiaceae bacterium]|nr:MAG: DUF3800 domain-containing protein [Verrucomicrobiaceae bacterium]
MSLCSATVTRARQHTQHDRTRRAIMKFCYCDETGTGEEPYAVLLGVVVDASRMHVTKDEWAEFLADLSKRVGHQFQEFHTRQFIAGVGIWKALDGQQRADSIDFFINWFSERKHHVVFSAIDKAIHAKLKAEGKLQAELETVWRTMGFHVSLAVQRNFQGERKNKGNTIFVFDEEVMEVKRFHELLLKPPAWSETYYNKPKKALPLNQLIDAPYFADSKHVGLLQVADFLAYFVRRYIEIREGAVPEKYAGEADKVTAWFNKVKARTLPYNCMYPKKGRCATADVFWSLAPACIRDA